jgi:hypothetical protein
MVKLIFIPRWVVPEGLTPEWMVLFLIPSKK